MRLLSQCLDHRWLLPSDGGKKNPQHPEAPCVVYHNTHSSHDNNASQKTTTSVLTYGNAQDALENHIDWLQSTVFVEGLTAGRRPFLPTQIIIIAYLSWNSVDLFLSVMACTGCSTSAEVKVIPALLNARWTAAEISTALKSAWQPEETEQTSSTPYHLLLYGWGLENKAKQAIERYNCSASGLARCMPIPKLSNIYTTPFPDPATKSGVAELLIKSLSDAELDKEIQLATDDSRQDFHEDAVIVYTSGTTSGGAKGVALSHRAVYVQSLAKLGPPCRYRSKTAMLATTVPFYHVAGLSSCLAVWLAGGKLVFPTREHQQQNKSGEGGSFDPNEILNSALPVHSFPCNTIVVVPTMLYSFLNHIPNRMSFPTVALVLIGGQTVSPKIRSKLVVTFPNARIVQTYACTEAASSLTFLEVTSTTTTSSNFCPYNQGVTSRPPLSGDCVGFSPKHVELCLFKDQANHQYTPSSTNAKAIRSDSPYIIGTIATRGPHVMNGYRFNGNQLVTPKTKWAINYKTWLRTNDLGFWDNQGRLFFCGRRNDSIRTGGETVVAAEVERVLNQHPDIAECAVFALPDDQFGQVVSCALVLSSHQSSLQGGILSALDRQQQQTIIRAVRRWCEQQGLAGYKRPRRIFCVQELPKNSSGKVLKFLLVERFGKTKQVLYSKL